MTAAANCFCLLKIPVEQYGLPIDRSVLQTAPPAARARLVWFGNDRSCIDEDWMSMVANSSRQSSLSSTSMFLSALQERATKRDASADLFIGLRRVWRETATGML